MCKRILIVIIPILLMWGNLTLAQDKDKKTYRWKNIQFVYPAYWTITKDKDVQAEGMGSIRLVDYVADQETQVLIRLFFLETPQKSDAKYKEIPALANFGLGFPTARNMAKPLGESAIALTYGSLELAGERTLSARFTISKPDTGEYYYLECFHYFSKISDSVLFYGLLQSTALAGSTVENLNYMRVMTDAYAALRNIAVQ